MGASQIVSERPSNATESDGEQQVDEPRHSRASLMVSEALQMRTSLAVESIGSDELVEPQERDSQSDSEPEGLHARVSLMVPQDFQPRRSRISISLVGDTDFEPEITQDASERSSAADSTA